jgi:IS605 OrfB family transposase
VSKKQQAKAIELVSTVVAPVVLCSDEQQVTTLMEKCGIVRSITYNKLGSLQGWGTSWMQADSIIRTVISPEEVGLGKTKKLFEWSVNDTMKAISAQQEAAKHWIWGAIWRKIPITSHERERQTYINSQYPGLERLNTLQLESVYTLFPLSAQEIERNRLFNLMHNNPTGDNWLHRQFRKYYKRGHTFKRNQIVYQGAGYECKRLNRHSVQLSIRGLDARKKIILKVRSRQIISGQIRLIRNDLGLLEIHFCRKQIQVIANLSSLPLLGIDKGYTEAFYTSNGDRIADDIGRKMTEKTQRITSTNRNRYRFWSLVRSKATLEPKEKARILENNLGYKVKSRKLKRDKATIQNQIRRDLRRVITKPVEIVCEDLSSPILGKKHSKHINRKLNQWMKGELQASLEQIAKETGSIVKVVNPAYTSQVDALTGTLLGYRSGDCFIRYTGDVIQADYNASINIRNRAGDGDITRYMVSNNVLEVLMLRTKRYLGSIGLSLRDAVDRGWLNRQKNPKFTNLINQLEPIKEVG